MKGLTNTRFDTCKFYLNKKYLYIHKDNELIK